MACLCLVAIPRLKSLGKKMTALFDVIVVGELNVDLILSHMASLPEVGKEKIAKKMTLTLGSSSAIFASNLSSLGMKVAFLGKVGGDVFGRLVLENLEKKKVDTALVDVGTNLNTGATIVLNFDEDRAMVTHQGAMESLTMADVTPDKLILAKHLHFSSYFLQPGFKESLGDLFRMAKGLGLTTSLDIQWDPMEKWEFNTKEILPFVDVFLPNEAELLHLTGQNNISDAIKQVDGLSRLTVVKKGNEGSLLSYNKKQIRKGPFLNKHVVDAIGAGDSFNAGFIFKFVKGCHPEQCQVFGNLMGAISTTGAGGVGAFEDYETTLRMAREKFGYTE